MKTAHSRAAPGNGRRKQSGQALVFGLFVMIAGAAMLFFVFNTGQLLREKTKLVNTADAAAYSAGVMTARTLNIASYANRAMVANTVAVAQMVSLQSWIEYLNNASPDAAVLGTPKYAAYNAAYIAATDNHANLQAVALDSGLLKAMAAESDQAVRWYVSEAEQMYFLNLRHARESVMNDVLKANYAGDGGVALDPQPLADDLGPAANALEFQNGLGGFVQFYTGSNRARFENVIDAVQKADGFAAPARNWQLDAATPGACAGRTDFLRRSGGTVHQDQAGAGPGDARWTANDELVEHYFDPAAGCAEQTRVLASAKYSIAGGPADGDYSGFPEYFDLSAANLDVADPRLRFAIRLTRLMADTVTSEGRSALKNTPRLNPYVAQPAGADRDRELAAVAASEAYFRRDTPNEYGASLGKPNEKPNLFDPFWHARLARATDEVNQARRLQGAAGL